MPADTYGSARDALKVLMEFHYGIQTVSQFNEVRARGTFVYAPLEQRTHPMPSRGEMEAIYAAEVGPIAQDGTARRDPVVEHFHRTRWLVCPALCGQRVPGRTWRYNLTALAGTLRNGPPGAEFRSKS